MDMDLIVNRIDSEATDDSYFVMLIPYMFLVLETIETALTFKANKQEIEVKLNIDEDLLSYLEIITLGSLLSIYKLNILSNKTNLNPSQFNIELLMQILQTKRDEDQYEDGRRKLAASDSEIKSENLNVQEHVLLLLSEIAGIFPDKVLEHVLIMFVFVGNKLARKDDIYSFHIISKIIKTILPSIVNSINSSNEYVSDMVKYKNDSALIVESGKLIFFH